MKNQTKDMKSKKKFKIKKEDYIKNLIFILLVLILIIIIFVLSLNNQAKRDADEVYNFNITEFENITPIGINEYIASLNFDGASIIFFCTNESKDCYHELTSLNSIAKENNLYIEFINVLELADSEKKQLKEISSYFKDSYYPNLMIIQNKKVIFNSNIYLIEEEIISLLEEYEIIK